MSIQTYPKYTQKILSYFIENKIPINKEKFNSKYIDFLTDIYKNIKPASIQIKMQDALNPINQNKMPLLYTILSDMMNNKSPKKFVVWFREHFNNFDLKSYTKKYSEYYDLLFNPKESRQKLHKLLYSNYFVSLDIIHFAETCTLNYTLYENNNTHIYVYTDQNGEKPDIDVIMRTITFFRNFTKKDIPVKLIILFTNQKKYFPTKKILITPENMNSGCTDGDFVYIWRKEEFEKVLIHELIHYFHIDYHECDTTKLKNAFHQLINIEGVDVINEAYTEIMAFTINSMIKSIEYNVSIDYIVNYEIAFTHFQIAKIINLFGGKNCDDLYKILIKQNTSLASYIIAKGILQNNYQLVLYYFDNNVLSNKMKDQQFKNYEKMFINLMHRSSLNNKMINLFLNLIQNSRDDKFIYNTLRMTLFG